MEITQYIKDNYGRCTKDKCTCLKEGWRGTGCPHWQPVKENSWKEMIMTEKSTFTYEFDYKMSHLTYRKPIDADSYDLFVRGIIHKQDVVDILTTEFRRDVSDWLDEELKKK